MRSEVRYCIQSKIHEEWFALQRSMLGVCKTTDSCPHVGLMAHQSDLNGPNALPLQKFNSNLDFGILTSRMIRGIDVGRLPTRFLCVGGGQNWPWHAIYAVTTSDPISPTIPISLLIHVLNLITIISTRDAAHRGVAGASRRPGAMII